MSGAVPTPAHTLTPIKDAARRSPPKAPFPLHEEFDPVAHTNYQFTSESVSEGHPDKVCDQISDAILDAFIENDVKLGIADESKVNTRLGCEIGCTKVVVSTQHNAETRNGKKYS